MKKKKDKTKKLCTPFLNIPKRAAVTNWNDENDKIAPSCLCFLNADNVSLAQYELIHQFSHGSFPDVIFALGTTQTLYIGNFLYADSSSPSNIMVFAFLEQEPNSVSQQTDYLICHLIQEQGQNKIIKDITVSPMQTMHIPKDFDGVRTKLQLFAMTLSICFGIKSICMENLFLLVGHRQESPLWPDSPWQILCSEIPIYGGSKILKVVRLISISDFFMHTSQQPCWVQQHSRTRTQWSFHLNMNIGEYKWFLNGTSISKHCDTPWAQAHCIVGGPSTDDCIMLNNNKATGVNGQARCLGHIGFVIPLV